MASAALRCFQLGRSSSVSQLPVTQFGYSRHPDQDRTAADAVYHPVVVVGAGPVGLTFAIDLAQRGQVNLAALITHEFPLGQVAEAFARAEQRSPDVVKAVVLL